MNKNEERILAVRSCRKFRTLMVYATALLFAAELKCELLGSTASVIALGADADRDAKQWVGTWATSAQPFVPASLQAYRNQSLRLIVHTSVGGPKVRIKIGYV